MGIVQAVTVFETEDAILGQGAVDECDATVARHSGFQWHGYGTRLHIVHFQMPLGERAPHRVLP